MGPGCPDRAAGAGRAANAAGGGNRVQPDAAWPAREGPGRSRRGKVIAPQEPYLIWAGGENTRVLIDGLLDSGVRPPEAVLDDSPLTWGSDIFGVPIAGGEALIPSFLARGVRHFLMGLGGVADNRPRKALFERALAQGLTPARFVHPRAHVSARANLAPGAQVMPMAVVQTGARIETNALINTGAIVEHDCIIGPHVHVATGARLAGAVRVGAGAHLGAGAVVKQGLAIGAFALVGAGAVVVGPVPDGALALGVPARCRPRDQGADRSAAPGRCAPPRNGL
ncbi:MAG: NeuD/PglB/VioB family sugar acetyltransferase [Thermodesulfobacteriota bacterium]